MKVCFIGHRKIEEAERLKNKIKGTVEKLIAEGADTFLFGSRSEFDSLCWEIVTELQTQFQNIRRIRYLAPGEETAFTSKEEREKFERIATSVTKRETHFCDYEEAVAVPKVQRANKNAYVLCNQAMIDNSDICVFYYNPNYLPPERKQSKHAVNFHQPQSGTAVAWKYAKRKKKRILNLL